MKLPKVLQRKMLLFVERERRDAVKHLILTEFREAPEGLRMVGITRTPDLGATCAWLYEVYGGETKGAVTDTKASVIRRATVKLW